VWCSKPIDARCRKNNELLFVNFDHISCLCMCIRLIAHCAQNISLEVFKATEFNKIWGRQMHRDVKLSHLDIAVCPRRFYRAQNRSVMWEGILHCGMKCMDKMDAYVWKSTTYKKCKVINVLVKVKDSRNRPGVAQRVPGGLGSQIFMTFGTWRWWCQSHAPVAFTPRNVPGTHFH
jgi:hypothetical protein